MVTLNSIIKMTYALLSALVLTASVGSTALAGFVAQDKEPEVKKAPAGTDKAAWDSQLKARDLKQAKADILFFKKNLADAKSAYDKALIQKDQKNISKYEFDGIEGEWETAQLELADAVQVLKDFEMESAVDASQRAEKKRRIAAYKKRVTEAAKNSKIKLDADILKQAEREAKMPASNYQAPRSSGGSKAAQ